MATRFLVIALVLALLAPASIVGQENSVAVIVHPKRSSSLSLEEIAQIYLRRKRFWSDGSLIVPLNLPSQTPLRTHFSRLVLNQTDARLADYWNRQYFYGVLPPPTLSSTEAVRLYVASDPNAIGYVPIGEVDGSVRVILSLE